MSIRTRIALVVLAVSSALTIAGVWFFDRQLVQGLQQTIDDTLDARAAPIVGELRDSRGRVDKEALARGVASNPISLAHVVDAEGRVVASSLGPSRQAEVLLPASRLGPLDRPRSFEVVIDAPELEETRLFVVPVDKPDGTWAVAVGTSLEATEHAQGVRSGLMIGGAIAVVLTAGGAWLLAHAALAPVERMRKAAAAITAGDDDLEIAVPGRQNELAGLASTFNDLLRRMRSALARERRLVADASHELRTPLTVMRTELELAARPGRSPDELRRAVDNAHAEATRLGQLAEDMLLLARSENGAPIVRLEDHDVARILDGALAAFEARASLVGVELRGEYERPLPALCDPNRLRQAVDNLLQNALTQLGTDGTVVVTAQASRSAITIGVADDGPGFPPDFLPHAFGPFQRADPARHREGGGAGLGLAIVRTIASAHGGEASATNRPGGGAVVRLTIPR